MMVDVSNSNDFYEEDEPIERIVAAFEHGQHAVTAAPLPCGAQILLGPATFTVATTLRPVVGVIPIVQSPSLHPAYA